MIDIREKAVTDNDAVAEIVALATEDLRRVYRRAPCQNGLAAPEGGDILMSLVAVKGEIVIGVVEYCVQHESLYIRGLAVHPQQRRSGIARALIHAAEGIAVRDGKMKVTLSTIKETGNPKIFIKLGFTVVHEELAEGFDGVEGQPVTKVDMCRML